MLTLQNQKVVTVDSVGKEWLTRKVVDLTSHYQHNNLFDIYFISIDLSGEDWWETTVA